MADLVVSMAVVLGSMAVRAQCIMVVIIIIIMAVGVGGLALPAWHLALRLSCGI